MRRGGSYTTGGFGKAGTARRSTRHDQTQTTKIEKAGLVTAVTAMDRLMLIDFDRCFLITVHT